MVDLDAEYPFEVAAVEDSSRAGGVEDRLLGPLLLHGFNGVGSHGLLHVSLRTPFMPFLASESSVEV